MYIYETHAHSNACSKCSESTAQEFVIAAKQKGYAGIIFTNHFFHGNTAIDRNLPWKEFVEAYRKDYIAARNKGKELDIDVLFGFEEAYGNMKEVLIYGISPETLAIAPKFRDMTLKEISTFVRSNGGLIFAAHPFRDFDTLDNPEYFDGVEVYNSRNTQAANLKAVEFTKEHKLLGISGGDIHHSKLLGTHGIALPHRVSTNQALILALKSNNYKLFVDGKLI